MSNAEVINLKYNTHFRGYMSLQRNLKAYCDCSWCKVKSSGWHRLLKRVIITALIVYLLGRARISCIWQRQWSFQQHHRCNRSLNAAPSWGIYADMCRRSAPIGVIEFHRNVSFTIALTYRKFVRSSKVGRRSDPTTESSSC